MKGNYPLGIYLLWPNLVTKCPKLILDISHVKGSISLPYHQQMTTQHFSLIASERQEKTSVSQAEDKKNIIALNFSNSGTMCTGVAINGALGKTISLRKMKCEEEPWCQFPPKRQLHPTALSHSGGWGSSFLLKGVFVKILQMWVETEVCETKYNRPTYLQNQRAIKNKPITKENLKFFGIY